MAAKNRQCAWELYVEMSTRVAVTGKPTDLDCSTFDGEILIESLSSLYAFFQEVRRMLKGLPVGSCLGNWSAELHTASIAQEILNVIRPFMEKWQASFRYWWEQETRRGCDDPPAERQKRFGNQHGYEQMTEDWSIVRRQLRVLQTRLKEIVDS